MRSILKKPSAFVPIMMSLTAFTLVLGYIAIHGISQEPQADESMAARIFQLLLAGQLPIIAFFAITVLPQKPKEAMLVVVMQIAAALSAFGLVYYLEM